MGTYYIAVFDDVRASIDPMGLGDLSPKHGALPLWAGLVVYGCAEGWGRPRYVADENSVESARVENYEDRTMLAYHGADEMGLVSSELRALARGRQLERAR